MKRKKEYEETGWLGKREETEAARLAANAERDRLRAEREARRQREAERARAAREQWEAAQRHAEEVFRRAELRAWLERQRQYGRYSSNRGEPPQDRM